MLLEEQKSLEGNRTQLIIEDNNSWYMGMPTINYPFQCPQATAEEIGLHIHSLR